jgi:hypothetical protein
MLYSSSDLLNCWYSDISRATISGTSKKGTRSEWKKKRNVRNKIEVQPDRRITPYSKQLEPNYILSSIRNKLSQDLGPTSTRSPNSSLLTSCKSFLASSIKFLSRVFTFLPSWRYTLDSRQCPSILHPSSMNDEASRGFWAWGKSSPFRAGHG